MLFSQNVNPKKSIYYYGAMIIQLLQKNGDLEIMELYLMTKQKYQIALMAFCLTLDWLYLIDSAKINKVGKVALCLSNN